MTLAILIGPGPGWNMSCPGGSRRGHEDAMFHWATLEGGFVAVLCDSHTTYTQSQLKKE